MKVKYSLLIAILITIQSMAQNGFNYKAIIKDGSGNLITNDLIVVQFSILQGAAQNNVYQETHTPSTDANGMIIINIGEGTANSGDFTTIDWGADTHFLNTQINTGSGFVDMGTTQFKTVPYALSAGNVNGLESINEGNGIGRRLVGKDPANYGNIGWEATDLSFSNSTSSTAGATGNYTLTTGAYTTASGDAATAMGYFTKASGNLSTAIGLYTNADAMSSTAIGRFNIGGGNPTNLIATDPLFEIGNGANNANRSNAITVLKNGTITAPSFDISEITDDKALITKEYADANLLSNGLGVIEENGAIGWGLIGANPTNFGGTGEHAISLTYSDGASSTIGATGNYSLATGVYTTASGFSSTAIGYATTAAGGYATAMGLEATATGIFSTATGQNTNAEAMTSTAMGRYNIGGGDATNWVATDPLFEVGNGTDNANRTNAITILKNGTITAPTFDISEITDDKALITKEYADANYIDVAPIIGINDLTDGISYGYSMYLGYNSGSSATDYYDYNLGVGHYSLEKNTTGIYNTAFGNYALSANITGNNNVAIGLTALPKNISGMDNTVVGYASLANNESGSYNTTLGRSALYNNLVSENTAIGYEALYANETGVENTAVGTHSLRNNKGRRNTAVGFNSLNSNVDGEFNTAVGAAALENNNGDYNTAVGRSALLANTTGEHNTSMGYAALQANLTGSSNSAFGRSALSFLTTGSDNTATGYRSLQVSTIGSSNSAFGKSAMSWLTTGSNNTALGYNAQVPSQSSSNQVRVGDTNVTYAGVQVAWTITSDKRWKDQIRELPYGLDMVMQLKPVDYIRKNNELKTREIGFIAQDVEELLSKIGYNDQGILSKDDEGNLSLRYNDFIPLLTKALQEQQDIILQQQKEIGQLTSEMSENKDANSKMFKALLERVSQLESQNNL